MGITGILGIGVGLSMDAFAVALCKGLGMKRVNYRHALVIALFFGMFQALMPVIGWALGTQFERFITPIDHWIAFCLLAFIGGKMLLDAVRNEGCTECGEYRERLDLRITFAFLHVDIVLSATIIGIITFAISFAGVVVGNRFGARFERPATIVGGAVLVLIGVKILLEHLGVLAF